MDSLRLRNLLKLPCSLIVCYGLTDYSPVFRCHNMGFNNEVYAFRFFNVSHIIYFDISEYTVSSGTSVGL
jgi:hypothetical protein